MSNADAILLQCTGRMTQDQWKELKALAPEAGASGARAYGNAEETYVWFDLSPASEVKKEAITALEGKISPLLGGAKVSGISLRQVSDHKGASIGFPSPIQYVVEMDFAPGSEAELNKWYEEEHLAGLSSVEGSVRSRRYVNEAGRSFACYDLVSNLVPETAEWQKWRATPWTERVRQHHQNMKRAVLPAL